MVGAGLLALALVAFGGYRFWQYQQNHASFDGATMETVTLDGDNALIIHRVTRRQQRSSSLTAPTPTGK